MGATDSRKILQNIDENFKSIRKYCDTFYGQITVLQHKSSKKHYALIQKCLSNPSRQFLQYLQTRKQSNSSKQALHLLPLLQYYYCDISLCSQLKNFFFLIEYSTHTLYQQIIHRQQHGQPWTYFQLISIMQSYTDGVTYMRQRQESQGRKWRWSISNSYVMYDGRGSVKMLQNILRNEREGNQMNYHQISGFDQRRQLYLSPEAYSLMCKGQKLKSKEVFHLESSLVFTLALNFLQLIVLADLSGIYDPMSESIDISKLSDILEEVRKQYGEEMSWLLIGMTRMGRQRIGLAAVREGIRRMSKILR